MGGEGCHGCTWIIYSSIRLRLSLSKAHRKQPEATLIAVSRCCLGGLFAFSELCQCLIALYPGSAKCLLMLCMITHVWCMIIQAISGYAMLGQGCLIGCGKGEQG